MQCGTSLQYSCLENPMDKGAWWAAVHGVAKSRTGLSNFAFTFHFHALEKKMATHPSVLAWRIPGMGEPGGLPSLGLHRVGHDWSNLAAAATVHLTVILSHYFLQDIVSSMMTGIMPLNNFYIFISLTQSQAQCKFIIYIERLNKLSECNTFCNYVLE